MNRLYSFDFIAHASPIRPGCMLCWSTEMMKLGRRRDLSRHPSARTLAVAGIFANGTPEQAAEFIPQCFGRPTTIKARRVRGLRTRYGWTDVSYRSSPGRQREATDEWVLERHQDLDHQRWAEPTTHVLVLSVEPELAAERSGSFVVRRRGPRGFSRARSSRRWASGRPTPPKVVLEDSRVPGRCLLGGKESWYEASGPGQRGQEDLNAGRPMATFEASATAGGAQAVRHRPAAFGSSPSSTREGAQAVQAAGSSENQAIAFKLAT